MENGGIRSDDFAGLLAALGRGVSAQPASVATQAPQAPQISAPQMSAQMAVPAMAQSFSPPFQAQQPLMWQPVPAGSFPNMYPQPQYIAPNMMPAEVVEVKKGGLNYWIVGLLIGAVVVCAALAWMRSMTMQTTKEDEEEEEEDTNVAFKEAARKEAREIPVPSSAAVAQDVDDFVANNVLRYVDEFAKDTIDISGQDIPLQYAPPSPEITRSAAPVKRRIVADESQEVLDYAKRREALFNESK